MTRDNVRLFDSQGGGGYQPQGGGYYGGNQRPGIDALMLVLSIINIVFGCCGISMILGIIALVYTVQAPKAYSYEETASKNRTAKILNIVGLVFIVVSTVASIIFSAVFMDAYMEMLEEILASEGVTF